jgi:hypothetical protein
MTLSELNEKLTRLTGESTTRYTNSQRAVDLTIALDKVVTMIIDSQDDADYDDPNHSDFPVFTTPLEPSQRDYTFSIGDDVLQYKEVEVSWDGTTYYKCQRLDRSLIPYATGNDTLLDNNYSKESPYYDIEGSSVMLYPRPGATDTGEVLVRTTRNVTPITSAEITTGTKVLGIDRAFHYMVVLLATQQRFFEQNIAGNKLQRVMNEVEDYETRLRRQYSRKQIDGSISFAGVYDLTDFN